MSNCSGCHHAFGEKPNPHQEECTICIRNPKYPTMKMPEKAVIDGIELTVPQDMYISRDRKSYEEKILMKKLAELMRNLASKKKEKKPIVWPYPTWKPDPHIKPWEQYWDYVNWYAKKGERWKRCQENIKSQDST